MLRRCTVLKAPPPKVLVLTMIPNGGALTPALRQLGFNPYTFEDVYRKGHVVTHPQEWIAVLRRQKPFSLSILDPGTTESLRESTSRKKNTSATDALTPYDSLVGPPATTAFEAVLRECPLSTRVILVEETDKLVWEKDIEQFVQRGERLTGFLGGHLGSPDLRRLLSTMTELKQTVRKGGGRVGSASGKVDAAAVLQTRALSLSACLDLFESHVRSVVPHDRLLVYRVEEGWKPLCDFLNVPVPTTTNADTDTGAASTDVEPQVLPFPAHNSAVDALTPLSYGFDRLNRVLLVGLVCIFALLIVIVIWAYSRLSVIFKDTREQFAQDFAGATNGGTQAMTGHEFFVLAKRSNINLYHRYLAEGKGYLNLIFDPPTKKELEEVSQPSASSTSPP